jgi:hypothetical protein
MIVAEQPHIDLPDLGVVSAVAELPVETLIRAVKLVREPHLPGAGLSRQPVLIRLSFSLD